MEDVYLDSPAAKAGILGGSGQIEMFDGDPYWRGGDVIVSVDGVDLTEQSSIQAIAERHRAGDVIPVRLWRHGQLMTILVKLEAAP